MNILFVYSLRKAMLIRKPIKSQEYIQIGISQLSALLKNAGHFTDLIVLDRRFGKKNLKNIDEKIKNGHYGMICFTSVNSEFNFIREIAQYIKQNYSVFTLIGGSHVTVNPQEDYLDSFDALCIGEGEIPIVELADKMDNGENIDGIKNLWLKKNDKIIKNPTNPFIQDLDSLPFPDREIWQPFILEPDSRLTILLGRGCPYNCTYCCNHKIRKVAEGKYVRLRSVNNIIEEIKVLSERFSGINDYFLELETLGTDIKWLQELCGKLFVYNKDRENKLKFGSNLRVHDNMDFELIFSNLHKANFDSVTIGLESGNPRIRKEILKRNYSNDTIRKAVAAARRFDIRIGIFNLMGLPTESYDDFLDTLKLNQEIQPDWHATSIFYPYEGTELYAMAKSQKLLNDNISIRDERQYAIFDLPEFPKKSIQRQYDRFHFNVYRKKKNKSILKYMLYLLQVVLGHGFMETMKNNIIVLLYKIGLKGRMLSIFQRS